MTFKEWMRLSNHTLDMLANEAERSRTADEETIYENYIERGDVMPKDKEK